MKKQYVEKADEYAQQTIRYLEALVNNSIAGEIEISPIMDKMHEVSEMIHKLSDAE